MTKFSIFFIVLPFFQCQGIDSSERGQGASDERPVEWKVPEANSGDSDKKKTSKSSRKNKKSAAKDDKKTISKTSQSKNDSNNMKTSSEDDEGKSSDGLEPLPPAGTSNEILMSVKVSQLMPVDGSFLRAKLDEFTGEAPANIDGQAVTLGTRNNAAGKLIARQYLEEQFEAIGFAVSEHDYGSGVNLIAEKKGLYTDRFLFLGAHYDSVETVGADDDASGVIASLAIAESLKDKELLYGLRIVLFDEEELGLLGSIAYVKDLVENKQEEEVIGAVVLEMLGYDSDDNGAFHIVDCLQDPGEKEADSGVLSNLLMEAVLTQGSALTRTDACTDRSDHTAFWQQGLPAVVVSQDFFGGDSNPCYHRDCDKTDMMNFEYYETLTTMVGSAVGNLVTKKSQE